MKQDSQEFKNFDSAMNKVLSISHDELQRREEKWKKDRKRKKLVTVMRNRKS